jgi:alpha-beta hydrolase superfamily lysophospholipase
MSTTPTPDPHVARYLPFFADELRHPVVPPVITWARQDDGTAVHLHRHPAPVEPPRATVVLLHGGGGHGRVLAALGVAAQHLGCAAVAPDLPGYGHTVVPDPGAVTYQDWIDTAAAVVRTEADAGPPVVLVGASIGGRLAIDVAHATGDAVAEVLATCLLDPRLAAHRRAATRHRLLADLGGPVLRVAPRALDRLRVPIRWLAPINAIANDPALARACATDRLGAGARVPLGFLRTWLDHQPAYGDPEGFRACPVTLVHPGDDRWTPLELSRAWFDRLPVDGRLVVLERCGHFPVEEPGISQLRDALAAAIDRATAPPSSGAPA